MSVSVDDSPRVLAIEGTAVRFFRGKKKQSPILDGLDIHVNLGIIYGLLGPSGCGKTTLLKCVVGHLKPQSGSIRVYGRVPGEAGFCIPGRGVGFMPQELALYTDFTIEEILTYFGRLCQMDYEYIHRRMEFLLHFLDIPHKKRTIRNLSGGQQRRVSLAAALIHKPPLLILDEPTVGVDPLLRQSIWEHLKTLASTDHMTIIITTHYVEEARQAHMVGLMRQGRLLAEMDPESIIRKHSSQTLEEVFLKLCRKDTEVQKSSRKKTSSQVGEKEEEEPNDGDVPDVWVTREGFQYKKRRLTEEPCDEHKDNKEDESHNDSLIFSTFPGASSLYRQSSTMGQIKEVNVRMTTLIKKGVTRLKRNIPFAFFQIFIPVIQVMVFCLCIGGEIFDLRLSVVNMEAEPNGFGQRFLTTLNNRTILQRPYSNLSLALDAVKRGEAWGAIYIGPRFTECLFDRFLESSDANNKTIECSKVKLYLDMTNQQISITVYTNLMESFQVFAREVLADAYGNPHLAEPPVSIEEAVYGSRNTKLVEFMVPGITIGIAYFMALALTGIIIINEKKEGLIDRSWTAGVTHGEVLFSIMFVFFFVMILQVALVLIFTFAAYNIPVQNSIFTVVACVLLAGLNGMANGLFISAICNDESAALMISMGSFLPNFLASGILWPLESMGYWLRYISYCLPLTLISHTLRSILSRGWSLADNNIWAGVLVSVIWTSVFLLLSWLSFRRGK